LIKGYLRAGARVDAGVVIDQPFNTTDVFIVYPVGVIAPRDAMYSGQDPEQSNANALIS